MTSTSETGHAKNVANFEKLIANITALGTPYVGFPRFWTIQK